jgi:protein SCO1/2
MSLAISGIACGSYPVRRSLLRIPASLRKSAAQRRWLARRPHRSSAARCLAAAVFLLGAAGPALAHEKPTASEALGKAESAVGSLLPPLAFRDTKGDTVRLGDFAGRPLLLSLVYTACTDICPTLIENLRPAVEVGQEALGRDSFAVVTVGFDSRNDSPERMRAFARERGIDLANWHFLAADPDTVDRLTRAVGFTAYPSAGGFEHMAQVTVVDAQGRIFQQVYGGTFDPPAIVEPLKDLVFGRQRSVLSLEGILDRVRFFCTIYNPNTGRYYFNYSLFLSLAIGISCLSLVLVLLIRELRKTMAHGDGLP